MDDLRLILVAPQPGLYDALTDRFAGLPTVELFPNRFEELGDYDCIVSPGNSFGLMDGGIDGDLVAFFGPALEARVQARILQDYLGEQPVGTSLLVETGHPLHPYLAHTPTMRVPMEISRTDYVYLATTALLRTVYHYNRTTARPIRRLACPGLGTGAGHVPFSEASRQMALAYKNFLHPPTALTWQLADARQGEIIYGGNIGSLP
jgi:O-acetyl-ADP-ribose deacetylase (regulator of RNase III)